MFFFASLERAVKVKWLAPALLVLTAAVSQAQMGESIETLLTVKELTYGDAALFVLLAVDQAELGIDTPATAFTFAWEQRWLPSNTRARDFARLDGVSLLLMKAFEFKGGLFYSLFPNAHHAYRELNSRLVIQERTDPMMRVSGDQLLFMLGRMIRLSDEEAAK